MKLTDLEILENYSLYISALVELYKNIQPFPLSNVMSVLEFNSLQDELENNPAFLEAFDVVLKRSYEDSELDYEETISKVFDIVDEQFKKKNGD